MTKPSSSADQDMYRELCTHLIEWVNEPKNVGVKKEATKLWATGTCGMDGRRRCFDYGLRRACDQYGLDFGKRGLFAQLDSAWEKRGLQAVQLRMLSKPYLGPVLMTIIPTIGLGGIVPIIVALDSRWDEYRHDAYAIAEKAAAKKYRVPLKERQQPFDE